MSDATPVLLIDDEKHIRLAGQQLLELAGFAVQGLDNATAALTLIDASWPGVVVCDIKMPGLDGLAFLAQALALDPDLPVILLTGEADIPMAVRAMSAGAYDFLEKPCAPQDLVAVIEQIGRATV